VVEAEAEAAAVVVEAEAAAAAAVVVEMMEAGTKAVEASAAELRRTSKTRPIRSERSAQAGRLPLGPEVGSRAGPPRGA
jgi:hypothetical protein